MTLQTVKHTKVRGTTYHYNIPIPSQIQYLYPSKTVGKVKKIFDGTMKTSDPKEAERLIRAQKVVMDRQLQEVTRKADQDRIAKMFAPEDAKLLTEIGGVDGLLDTVKEYRIKAAFALAGQPDLDAPEIEGGYDTPPKVIIGGGLEVTPMDRMEHNIAQQETTPVSQH